MRSFLGSLITLPFLRVVGPEEELEDEGPVILPFEPVAQWTPQKDRETEPVILSVQKLQDYKVRRSD